MSKMPVSVIKYFKDSRSLVTVERESLSPNKIQGFIVDYDKDWLLIQYLYEFHLDGWLLLRISDVSSLQSLTSDIFQRTLMENKGVLEQIDFDKTLHDGGIRQWLESFNKEKVIIIEDESDEYRAFWIGFINKIEKDTLFIQEFSGAGRFEEEMSSILIEDVTSVSFESNYAQHYQEYFDAEHFVKP